jgi:hypothetical protein
MPSRAPRHDASKKREQLSRSKEALVRVIRGNQSHEKQVRAAEEYRTAYLSFLKAKLHWANEALIARTASLSRGAGNLRAKAASVTAQSDIERLESEIATWSGKSAEDVLRESGLA